MTALFNKYTDKQPFKFMTSCENWTRQDKTRQHFYLRKMTKKYTITKNKKSVTGASVITQANIKSVCFHWFAKYY